MCCALDPAESPVADSYEEKNDAYFSGRRSDYVAELERNPDARILEIGCGNGDTGALALSEKKCGVYCGVEIDERAAREARSKLSEVVVGNVESLQFPWEPGTFDALILSEVLEHLTEPGRTLSRLRPLLKSGARVLGSSPNVSHLSVIRMLLSGRWDLEDAGIMDRTHLRWFTPASFRELFESSGYAVDSVEPLQLGPKSRLAVKLMLGRGQHLFHRQIDIRARVG